MSQDAMPGLSKPTTVGVYEVRYWDGPRYADSTVTMFEDESEAYAYAKQCNDAGLSTGSRYRVVEHVLHLRQRSAS